MKPFVLAAMLLLGVLSYAQPSDTVMHLRVMSISHTGNLYYVTYANMLTRFSITYVDYLPTGVKKGKWITMNKTTSEVIPQSPKKHKE